MINLFAIFASEDGKQLLSRLYVERMLRIRKLANYADPHYSILSDALYAFDYFELLKLMRGVWYIEYKL